MIIQTLAILHWRLAAEGTTIMAGRKLALATILHLPKQRQLARGDNASEHALALVREHRVARGVGLVPLASRHGPRRGASLLAFLLVFFSSQA